MTSDTKLRLIDAIIEDFHGYEHKDYPQLVTAICTIIDFEEQAEEKPEKENHA